MAKRSRRARVGSSKANALITPGRRISASKAIAGIERLNDQVVRQLRREAAERQRFARESTRAMEPMIRLLQQDKVAMAAHRNLQKLTTPRAALKARFPDVLQQVENQVRAGSIMSIVGAPYDFEWGAEGPRNGTTWGTYVSYKSGSDPRFNSNVNIGAGGSSWASGGLGKQFVPAGANTTWVRIGVVRADRLLLARLVDAGDGTRARVHRRLRAELQPAGGRSAHRSRPPRLAIRRGQLLVSGSLGR